MGPVLWPLRVLTSDLSPLTSPHVAPCTLISLLGTLLCPLPLPLELAIPTCPLLEGHFLGESFSGLQCGLSRLMSIRFPHGANVSMLPRGAHCQGGDPAGPAKPGRARPRLPAGRGARGAGLCPGAKGGQELTSRGAEKARGERLAPVTATSLSPVHPVAQQGAQPRGGVQGVGFPGPGCRPASPLTPWDRAKPRPHEEEILVLIYQRRRQKCVRGTPGAPRVTV